MKRKIHICLAAILFAFAGYAAHAQDKMMVSGTVTDENNEPMIGVSVAVQGATMGAATDLDGKFTLSVVAGAELKFTYVGYVPVTAKARAGMEVKMEPDATTLDEITVVGIGYGTARRSDLTGAISSVKAKDLKQGMINNPMQMMQGKVSGLVVVQQGGKPDDNPTVRLRGGSSLKGDNTPLYVIDGIVGADIRSVSPGDIESMDVLKDASAAAIYGSRGANGVILVTTRKGETGKISYNGYVGVEMPKLMDLLTADEWRTEVARRYNEGTPIANAVGYGGNTDWQRELTRNSISHQHNLSYGAVGKTNGMHASLVFLDKQGIVQYNDMQRVLGNVSAFQTGLNGKLRVELLLNARADQGRNQDYNMGSMYKNPTIPLRDENGDLIRWLPDATGGSPWENPLVGIERGKDNNEYTDKALLGFAKAELEIVKGLKATGEASYEYRNHLHAEFNPLVDDWQGVFSGHNDAKRKYEETLIRQGRTFLTYEYQKNEHRGMLMGGYEYMDEIKQYFEAKTGELEIPEFKWNNLGTGNKKYFEVGSGKERYKLISFFGRLSYTYNNRYSLNATLRRDGSTKFGANNKWGMFPSAAVSWRISEENFMAGLRETISNAKLRVSYGITGNQNGIDPYQTLTLVSRSGGRYYDKASGEWRQAYTVTQNPNPDLKWESTEEINIGLDVSLFNRLNITLEGYRKMTYDLLNEVEVPTPPYLTPKMWANVGNLSNTGVELTVSADILRHKDYGLSASLTMAHNDRVLQKLSNNLFSSKSISAGRLKGLQGLDVSDTQELREGDKIGTFYGPLCEGIATEDIPVYDDETGHLLYTIEKGEFIVPRNKNGSLIDMTTKTHWVNLGNMQPLMTMGFSLNGSWRNFDLTLSTWGAFGQKIMNAHAMNTVGNGVVMNGGNNVTRQWLDYGFSNTSKRMVANYYSSFWIEDGSYLRLQNVIIGYTIPDKFLKSSGLQRLRVYIEGDNLLTLTKYTGLDPEVSTEDILSTDAKSRAGIDWGNSYPKARAFSAGINVSF
ncbi:MAG: TonB-dependent receptor [Dysgonamonadaceae bacterium]|jgi:iron complex outermembrane receptor protein|nr:TonB-dependent receptor [Dysgonamonadaceae bacterium]